MAEIKAELLRLNAERSKKEEEMKTWMDLLQSQKVGMTDSLVDDQGFPRNDVDIFQVRTARNKIICLQNDCRMIMKQLEEKLHQFHALNPSDPEKPRR